MTEQARRQRPGVVELFFFWEGRWSEQAVREQDCGRERRGETEEARPGEARGFVCRISGQLLNDLGYYIRY